MPEVDFYILSEPGEAGLLRVACRVAEKAWSQGFGVLVLAADDEQADRVDDALWSFRPESFVPHARWRPGAAPGDGADAPVLVGAGSPLPPAPEVLVNLGAPLPPWFRDCVRVAEVVGGDAQSKACGRQRYREYREAGIELRTHEV